MIRVVNVQCRSRARTGPRHLSARLVSRPAQARLGTKGSPCTPRRDVPADSSGTSSYALNDHANEGVRRHPWSSSPTASGTVTEELWAVTTRPAEWLTELSRDSHFEYDPSEAQIRLLSPPTKTS